MLVLDDVLLSPFQGLLWIFRKIHEAAQEEIAGEVDAISAELTELYRMLESGTIIEAEFEARERVLLDRLDAVRTTPTESGGEEGDDEEDADEGEGEGEEK